MLKQPRPTATPSESPADYADGAAIKKKRKSGIPTGNAGEYLVMGELLRRGYDAQLADRNTQGYDLLVGRPGDDRLQKVQVKTVRVQPWFIRVSDFMERPDQPTVYVLLGPETATADHLLRAIDRFVDLSDLRARLAPFYSETGRPSIDPELLIRMLLVGYCHGIRSERRLCEEVHLNLAYRWFCRLGLDGDVPDHSTFSKNRHGRFRDSDLLRHLFEAVLCRCVAEGLVGGEGFAVDASLIKADANRQRGVEGSKGLAPEMASRAIDEYLSVLDDAAFGAATEVTPKFISPGDPAARWTGAHGGLAFFAYSTNYLIDLDNAIIVDVEASTAIRQAEVTAAKTMIERVDKRFGLYPERLAADTAYGSGEMLDWLVHERGIEPHIPVFDKSKRTDDTFSRSDFTYDHEGDVYFCPGGKMLTCKGTLVNDGDTLMYRASKYDCRPAR